MRVYSQVRVYTTIALVCISFKHSNVMFVLLSDLPVVHLPFENVF